SYRVELPLRLLQRGIHNVFHLSLLRVHVPNDDRLFPGRMDNQVADFEDKEYEWAVDRITGHSGTGVNSLFEIRWKSGDITWLPYDKVIDLNVLLQYLKLLGV
ncbi:hypothetical protein BDN72DRAFT_752192, partial [Pluteus cervinus]